jgi:hypothetical protein
MRGGSVPDGRAGRMGRGSRAMEGGFGGGAGCEATSALGTKEGLETGATYMVGMQSDPNRTSD